MRKSRYHSLITARVNQSERPATWIWRTHRHLTNQKRRCCSLSLSARITTTNVETPVDATFPELIWTHTDDISGKLKLRQLIIFPFSVALRAAWQRKCEFVCVLEKNHRDAVCVPHFLSILDDVNHWQSEGPLLPNVWSMPLSARQQHK